MGNVAQVAQISSAQRMKPLGLIVAHSDCHGLNSLAFRLSGLDAFSLLGIRN